MIGHIPFGFGGCAFFFVYSRQSLSISISDFEWSDECTYLKKPSNKNTKLGIRNLSLLLVF